MSNYKRKITKVKLDDVASLAKYGEKFGKIIDRKICEFNNIEEKKYISGYVEKYYFDKHFSCANGKYEFLKNSKIKVKIGIKYKKEIVVTLIPSTEMYKGKIGHEILIDKKEKELIIKRAKFIEEFNKVFDAYVKSLMYVNGKVKNKKVDLESLNKYISGEVELVDENSKNLSEILNYSSIKYNTNESKKYFNDLSNLKTFFDDMNVKIESEINNQLKSTFKNKKQSKPKYNITERSIDEDNVRKVLYEGYKYNRLVKNLERINKWARIDAYIRVVKKHYTQNVATENTTLTEEEKFILKVIHGYVKGRYKKYLRLTKKQKENQGNIITIFKLDKLENKIIDSVLNKYRYHMMYPDVKEVSVENDIYRQIRKMDSTLKLKLVEPFATHISYAMKDRDSQDDKLYGSGDFEKFKNEFKVETSEAVMLSLFRMRNLLYHHNSVKDAKEMKEKCDVDLKSYLKKLHEDSIESVKKKLSSNNVDKWIDSDELNTLIEGIVFFENSSEYLPRFNKVFTHMKINHFDENLVNSLKENLEKEQAYKYCLQLQYQYKFSEWLMGKYISIGDIKNLYKDEVLLTGLSDLDLSDLSRLKEYLQRHASSIKDKNAHKKVNNMYVAILAYFFSEFIKEMNPNVLLESSIENKLDNLGFKVKEIRFDTLTNSTYMLLSLAQVSNKYSLNQIHQSLLKYIQFYNSLKLKYSKDGFEIVLYEYKKQCVYNLVFSEIKELEVLCDILQQQISVKSIINTQNIANKKIFSDSVIQIYGGKYKSIAEIKYEYTDVNKKILHQEIFKQGKDDEDNMIMLDFFIENDKYKFLDYFIDAHKYAMSECGIKYDDILKEYGSYKSVQENGETKITNLQSKYSVYIEKSKKSDYFSIEDMIKVKDEINKFNFYSNLIYLSRIKINRNMILELQSRLVTWIYTYEKNYPQINKIQKFDWKNADRKLRNNIMHKNYMNKIEKEKYIEEYSKSMITLYNDIKELNKDISAGRRNDVSKVKHKILESYNVTLFDGKCEPISKKINDQCSIKKICDEEANYIFNILKYQKSISQNGKND